MMSGSGSAEFDALRNHILSNGEVKREVEFAFSSLLTAANPSDRGLRFLFGNGAEWIMAAASWSAGVLTAPAGHNANGFDLGDLLNQAKGLWSVKASASSSAGDIRLKNFMGDGSNADWTEPTLFVGAYLKGAVLVDPTLHRAVKDRMRHSSDALLLGGGVVKRFALDNPENYVAFDVAINQGGGVNDPYAFVKSVITPEHFPVLSRPFLAATPIASGSLVEEIKKLADLRDLGVLDDESFKKAVDVLTR
jgi:hypothetical protein